MKKIALFLSLLGMILAGAAEAQIRTPQPSPASEVHQNVGLGKVELVYSRPGMKGRTIFAEDGLVPFGKLWRTGANQATKITFSEDATFGGEELKAGSYTILTIPTAEEWTVNLYAYESSNFTTYLEKTPDASVKVKTGQLSDKLESFTMSFQNLSMNGAHLMIAWENTMVAVPIETEVDEKVTANIEQVMAGPSAQDMYAAATYYHDTGKDLNKALEWITKANEMSPRFWMLRRQSLIQADLGKVDDAIASAKRSLELAKEAGNDDYIRMNEASIKEWTAKMNK